MSVVTPVGTPLIVNLNQQMLAWVETVPSMVSRDEIVLVMRGAADWSWTRDVVGPAMTTRFPFGVHLVAEI